MATDAYSSVDASDSQSTYVYFISAGSMPIKIGVSSNPHARLADLQTAHYQRLHLLYTVECSTRAQAFELESAFHRWYGEQHIRNEWFALSPQRIADDISLLTTLSQSIVGAQMHVSLGELLLLEESAKERSRAGAQKTSDARAVTERYFAVNPKAVFNGNAREIAAELGVGKSTVYVVMAELREKHERDAGARVVEDGDV